MEFAYKLANLIRKIYWFIFRPKTFGIKCLLENNGNYLLIKNSYSGNYWTLPGGGIRLRESPQKAVIREVQEELGIDIDLPVKITEYKSILEYKKDTIYCFYKSIDTLEFKLNNGEVSEAQWFPKDQLPRLQSRALRESITGLKI